MVTSRAKRREKIERCFDLKKDFEKNRVLLLDPVDRMSLLRKKNLPFVGTVRVPRRENEIPIGVLPVVVTATWQRQRT